ncbi:probable E3 ubiquitin-protein ligase RHB1A isoform X1 [Primulina eburnea]|uniref:probable E3 ubiquitin-protein ligase RHB1A isoform X1 n=1 Tax=Primulina eburnea TaxID=1245227 RepID=UPI003C6BDF4D
MGGCCCCCASESTEQNSTSAYFNYPVSEEHEPLSPHISTVTTLSTGILVDTNLDTSVPDTYRSPPAPLPFGPPPAPPSNQEIPGNKVAVALKTTNTIVVEDTNLETKLKSLNSDGKAEINIDLAASKESENENSELKKSVEPFVPSLQDEEDVCPTCLEEYDSENPKIITGCDHHFHLACILEWMERSDACPICDQEMAFSPFTGE